MFDQVNDDGVEALGSAVVEVVAGVLIVHLRDQRPCGLAVDVERSAALIDQVALIAADLDGVCGLRQAGGGSCRSWAGSGGRVARGVEGGHCVGILRAAAQAAIRIGRGSRARDFDAVAQDAVAGDPDVVGRGSPGKRDLRGGDSSGGEIGGNAGRSVVDDDERPDGDHLDGPTSVGVGVGAGAVAARVAGWHVLHQVVVEVGARGEARANGAGGIAHAVGEDQIIRHRSRDRAARDPVDAPRGACLPVDRVRQIGAGVFGGIDLDKARISVEVDGDGIGAAFDVGRVIEAAAGSAG